MILLINLGYESVTPLFVLFESLGIINLIDFNVLFFRVRIANFGLF